MRTADFSSTQTSLRRGCRPRTDDWRIGGFCSITLAWRPGRVATSLEAMPTKNHGGGVTGRGPAANPKFFQLVTRHAPRLRTRRNPRNPNPLICLLHNSRTAGVVVPGQGYRRTPRRRLLPIQSHLISRSLLFSVPSVISRLKSAFQSVPISARSRKPSPLRLPLLTTHSHPYFITSLPGPPAKIRAANSIGAIHV
jgi:hypothetical protein